LLEDRFQLKTHRETREVSGYLMTVAKGGLKIKPTEEGGCVPVDPTDLSQSAEATPGTPFCLNPKMTRKGSRQVFEISGITIENFAKLLHPDSLPVIDRTGLTGRFDIHLEWDDGPSNAPAKAGGAASDPSPYTSAIVATREQLGLRLDPGKGKREVLVIDRVEKPSGN
jgi:uncharacterized protein (TIGR03435 family)